MNPLVRWLPVLAGCLVGCATLDALSVGRTDRLPRAPFYVTYERNPVEGPVLILPVAPDLLAREEFLSQGRSEALEPLLTDLGAALAGQGCCSVAADAALPGGAPQLYVGSLEGEFAPSGTGIERQPHEEYPPMIAHLMKPAEPWRDAVAALAGARGATRVVLISVSFTQFPKADSGFFGKKVVLGTDHEEKIRFLSAVDKPVEVLAITGMVLDAQGNVLRAGAEGIAGMDPEFWVQVLELGQDLDPAAIARLRTERRDELPGRPFKWQAALDQLLHQLLRPV